MTKYPARLLPKSTDKIISKFNPNHILCRGVDSRLLPLRDEMGKLSALAVDEVRIPGYSTNKVPRAEISDIQIGISDREINSKLWEEGSEGWIVDEKVVFEIPDRKYFLIRIKDIDGYSSKYPLNNNPDPTTYCCTFVLKVKHAPLIANFPHCELIFEYKDENGKPFKASDKVQKKIINADVRQHLIEYSKFNVADF